MLHCDTFEYPILWLRTNVRHLIAPQSKQTYYISVGEYMHLLENNYIFLIESV